jgi:serine/threonine protein kinase
MIGCGAFGVVYRGTHEVTGEEVAIKIESAATKAPQVLYEAKVYNSLARRNDGKVPKVHWHGAAGSFNIMVMELLGPSLEDVFVNYMDRKCSQIQVSRLGLKILEGVEYLHSMGFIHRDIKPDNIVFKKGSLQDVQIIDFGLAKKYTDKTQCHIPFQVNKACLSDSAFVSLRTHFGLQQSRRDDLESVAYVLLYLSRGSLAWDGLKPQEMMELKASSAVEKLCREHLAKFLRYSRDLPFEKAPNYNRLRKYLNQHITSKTKHAKEDFGQYILRVHFPSHSTHLSEYNFVSDWTFHTASKAPVGHAVAN